MLSALCLGLGTMISYKRIVKTLGERLGNVHLTPAQGASAALVQRGLNLLNSLLACWKCEDHYRPEPALRGI